MAWRTFPTAASAFLTRSLILIAIAKTQRVPQAPSGASQDIAQTRAQKARAASVIVESPLEQPWAEFCRSLKRPAFLLADGGQDDLEQP